MFPSYTTRCNTIPERLYSAPTSTRAVLASRSIIAHAALNFAQRLLHAVIRSPRLTQRNRNASPFALRLLARRFSDHGTLIHASGVSVSRSTVCFATALSARCEYPAVFDSRIRSGAAGGAGAGAGVSSPSRSLSRGNRASQEAAREETPALMVETREARGLGVVEMVETGETGDWRGKDLRRSFQSVGLAANCSRSSAESAGSECGGSETGRRRKKTVGWRVSTGKPAL